MIQNSNVIEELELLAKWRGAIEGRAASLEVKLSSTEPHRARAEFLEKHLEEIRSALRASRTLERLYAQGPIGRAHAQLLLREFVLFGEESKRRSARKVSGLAGALRRKKLSLQVEAALDAYRELDLVG
jgi:hypothetical protein